MVVGVSFWRTDDLDESSPRSAIIAFAVGFLAQCNFIAKEDQSAGQREEEM